MDIESIIERTIQDVPIIEGPVPVTLSSHPFCAMSHSRTPLDLNEYGYQEEEFFLTGRANVYDADSDDRPVLYKQGLPYKNRIIVRRPGDKSQFSGRVYVDILNATQGYDIEDFWHRAYLWCMEHGHAYVGITSKPINVMSLKNYDYWRYKSLDWSNGELVAAPVISRSATIPGTEEGLFWDMLGQLGYLLRMDTTDNCLGGFKAEYIYLTGQSQSGAYLNTYVNYFDRYITGKSKKGLFDGYCNIVGALVQRSIRQEGEVGDLRLIPRKMHPSKMPYICISSEADLYLFNMFVEADLFSIKIENKDEINNKCRYYEIPGTPHTDIICPVLTSNEELEKTGAKMPNLSPHLLKHINDIPMEYYICGLLDKLHIWACEGKAPEIVEPMRRCGKDLLRDEHGNAIGGLRTPFVDVPIATYIASNPDDPEGICGKMCFFPKDKVCRMYGSIDCYLERFEEYTQYQMEHGWISTTDGKKMIEWSRQMAKCL